MVINKIKTMFKKNDASGSQVEVPEDRKPLPVGSGAKKKKIKMLVVVIGIVLLLFLLSFAAITLLLPSREQPTVSGIPETGIIPLSQPPALPAIGENGNIAPLQQQQAGVDVPMNLQPAQAATATENKLSHPQVSANPPNVPANTKAEPAVNQLATASKSTKNTPIAQTSLPASKTTMSDAEFVAEMSQLSKQVLLEKKRRELKEVKTPPLKDIGVGIGDSHGTLANITQRLPPLTPFVMETHPQSQLAASPSPAKSEVPSLYVNMISMSPEKSASIVLPNSDADMIIVKEGQTVIVDNEAIMVSSITSDSLIVAFKGKMFTFPIRMSSKSASKPAKTDASSSAWRPQTVDLSGTAKKSQGQK